MPVRKSNHLYIIFLAFLLFAISTFAQAEENAFLVDDPPAANVPVTKKVFINYEDELLNGAGPTPEADYIFTRSQFNFKKMIKFRDDFIPEATRGKDEYSGTH
jgi:hypothetical protein